MTDLFYNRLTCRLCGSEGLENAMPLTPTPVGDKYLPPERKEESRDVIPLDLMLCTECGQLQTGAVVNPAFIYKHYLSRPATVNPTLSNAYQEYAESILTRYKPGNDDLVIEIGSNDGAFIGFLRKRSVRVLGIDPAENLAAAATQAGIETIPDFFSRDLAARIRADRGPASVVVANFMFANVDNLSDFTLGIRDLLAPDGVFMFETNYRVDVFQKYLLETINHEHLSYFAVKPLQQFFARHGMDLIAVERVPSKGGSIRCTVQLAGGPHPRNASVEEHIALEQHCSLYNAQFYRPCAEHIRSVRGQLQTFTADARSSGKRIAGYGTSIGATIFIYQLGLGPAIDFLVDDDPYRQNLVSPGYHIPVVSSLALRDQKPDFVFILAPLYANKIIDKNAEYVASGGRFVCIWPEVEVKGL